MRQKQKDVLCGRWLAACLLLGWKRSDLDWLEKLWVENKGWRFWNGQY